MRQPRFGGSGRALIALLLGVALAAALAMLAGPAAAAPIEDTMTLARLQELLEASPSGTVDGYFKTAVKGADIATIPCTIEGVVPQAAADNGDLIMFEATGPIIDKIGGIADGMSGSPVYVDDGGDKLVGAVSYGEYLTIGGLGLATPIEHMMTLETDFDVDPLAARLARTIHLDSPVASGDGNVNAIVVAPTLRAARRAATDPHTVVMRSLSIVQVGGVGTDTQAFRQIRHYMTDHGIDVRGGVSGGAANAAPGFETPLAPGSSVGELFMRGDFWYGAVGTTTYTTLGDELVAFGHPVTWDGTLCGYMTNADVIGLWGSIDVPFKVVAPGEVRGTVTVDSGAGIAGVIGDPPDEVPFTCTATNTATGKTVTTHAFATQWAADQAKEDPYAYLNALSFDTALYQATGDTQYDGHIEYTMTIDVTDGVDVYTITRTNVWEDTEAWDAPFVAVVEMIQMLTTVNDDPDGTIHAHLQAVRLDATISPVHNRARVVDVTAPNGVQTGENTFRVTMYEYGNTEPVTVDVPLTIPEDMSTLGDVYAKAPFTNIESEGDGWYGFYEMFGPNYDPPDTLASLVDELNSAHPNSDLLVAYDPPGGEDYEDDRGFGEPWGDEAIVVAVDTGQYLTGEIDKQQAEISLQSAPRRATTGDSLVLLGYLGVDAVGDTVEIYKREAGTTTDTLVTEVPVTSDPDDEEGWGNVFVAEIPKVTRNTRYSAVWGGDDDYLRSGDTVDVEVAARVGLTAKSLMHGVQLTARVVPANASGLVSFQRHRGGRWVNLRAVRIDSRGNARITWRPMAGRYEVRAAFMGSEMNGPGRSRVRAVTIR